MPNEQADTMAYDNPPPISERTIKIRVVPDVEESCGMCKCFLITRLADGPNSASGKCRFSPLSLDKLDFDWCGQWSAKKQ